MMTKRNFYFAFVLLALLPLRVLAQLSDPVSFSIQQKRVSPTEIVLTFTGSIEPGWHVYSTDLSGGPTPATFHFDRHQGIEAVGKLQPGKGERNAMDPVFGMKVRFFEHTATFTQKLKITSKDYSAKGYLEYGACNDQNCMPPTPVDFEVKGSDGPATATAAPAANSAAPTDPTTAETALPATVADTAAADTAPAVAVTDIKVDDSMKAQWWQPSIKQLQAFGDGTTHNRSLPVIFLLGMLGGLIALLTPCVWPIIPMTVSFFLHRNNNRRRAIREAVLYGLSIVVIYVGLGLLVTLLSSKGSYALNDISTNAVFNIFLFLLLIVFAASFLGGFEITLPSSWNNKVNQKADTTTGVLSIFLMAFTLALVSFSCTGPIIGFLLVEISTQGNILFPAVGMLGFAIALALPFSFFALFPSLLKKLPKSGGWMNVIKVTLGFVELAFALKFLSVADLAYGWHILDRETFLALWIVLFGLLGIYLLGKIRFPGDYKTEVTSVPRFFLGLISLAFAVYMIPGLWGAPLKAVSAFAPPIYTQDFNLNQNEVKAQFRDYEEGMAYAAKMKKPVLLDFTGFGCVNCRKMEMAVWNDPQVQATLKNDFVLISLFVDDKTPLPQHIEVTENGRTITLRTVGDKWSYLERAKFGANTQPFYVPLNNEGQPLNRSYSYKEDVGAFLKFLHESSERMNK